VQVLHRSAALRQLLGVREFSPRQLLELLRALESGGRLQELGTAWLQRALLAVFSLLAGEGAGAGSAGSVPRSQVGPPAAELDVGHCGLWLCAPPPLDTAQ
jgi:hypothetical protein